MLAWEDKKELVTSGSHLVGPPGDVQTEAKLEKSMYLKTDKNEHRSIIIGGIELPRASVSKCGDHLWKSTRRWEHTHEHCVVQMALCC